MSDWLPEIDEWVAEGRKVAIATVVKVGTTAPRPVGSRLAVTAEGEMAGSVSGGCVESAVVLEAQQVLKSGTPKLLKYGISDRAAWEVGLACGGKIEVFVEPLEPVS